MLIPFVWLYVFKCDVYTQLLVNQTQKDFEYFICFWKCFYTFVCLEFLFKMSISCFYQKTLLEAFSRVSRKLAIPTKMRMAKNKKTLKFIQRLSRLSREKQLPTKQLICFSGIFESNFARSLPTKSACFQFLKANSDSFSKVLDSKTLRTNVLKLQFVLY